MSAVDTCLELSRERLKDQSDTLRLVTTKASIMLGIAALVATGDVPNEAQDTFWLICMYLSVIACGGCGLFAIFPRNHWEGPDLKKADEILRNYEHDDAREWIAEANIMACQHNARHLSRIGVALHWGLVSLALSITIRVALQFIHSA